MRLQIEVAITVLLAGSSAAWAVTPVTTCGQIVHGVGELVGDLDCSTGERGSAVSLDGTLRLNGFTITGMHGGIGVGCSFERCRIVGPGTITGPNDVSMGVYYGGSRTLHLVDVTIQGVRGQAAQSSLGKVRVLRSTITNNGGFIGPDGIFGGGVRARGRAMIKDSTITGNVINGVQVTKETYLSGRAVSKVIAKNSVIDSNGTAPDCDVTAQEDPCGDIVSFQKPALRVTTCSVSVNPTGGDWDVCAGD